MAISHDPPSVLIGPGDFHTGPYYIIISGLPERTSWQDVKDFIKSQIPWKLDIYVSIFGKRQDSGWVRVIGFKAFNHVRRVLGESLFRGREILAHNPGYDETGAGLVLVRAPFFRDRSLFINPEALAADPTTSGSAVQVAEEYITPTASNPPSEQSYPGEPGQAQHVRSQVQGQGPPQATAPDVHFPPTPPNTPKATRSTSEPSMSLSGSRFRKLAITWREDPLDPTGKANPSPLPSAGPLSPSTQEEMGSSIKAELAPLLLSCSNQPSDPLETLECFPGTALATFISHELARRAIKVLRQSERLNARPVVDEVPAGDLGPSQQQSQTVGIGAAAKKLGSGKKISAGAGTRTVSAPAPALAVARAGTTSPIGASAWGTPTTTNTATTPAITTRKKAPAVLVVNGSWKI
ncbi:hypothetical protein B0T09DRAFT_162067 [Sordaria sp. MPI-SDFR-AT-0083]|nr:hypothetical protein B0T09DRAFT_162067 [Sordaria sp. MPI-SDFR-AT-0083]